MTNSQIEALNMLKETLLAKDANGRDGWVYRKFHVEEFPGERWVVLQAVTGHEDDAGTLAEVLYRREHIIWVGSRGRILELNRPDKDSQAPALSLTTALKEPYRQPARTGQGRREHGTA